MSKLDVVKWDAERIGLETEIRALKHAIRRDNKPQQKLVGIN